MQAHDPKASRAARRASLVLCLVAGAGLIVLALRDPGSSRLYPTCPTFRYLGIQCAGCGTLRAVHALTKGHLMDAVAYNPLFVAALPLLVAWGVLHGVRALTGWQPRRRRMPLWVPVGCLVVLVVYSLLRNVPARQLDWLRPPVAPAESSQSTVPE